jgi:hypothetical protein
MKLVLTSPPIPRDYEPTVEDRLHAAEFFAEEEAVAQRRRIEREIAETDTRDERTPRASTPDLTWRREKPFEQQVAEQLETLE